MPDSNIEEPIANDELLLRRIPASQNWVNVDAKSIDPLAFRPRESDTTGLSFGRAGFETPAEEAAKGAHGRSFFIAVLSVESIRKAEMEVVPRPLPNDPGHAEISDLTFANRRSDRSRELVQRLCDSVVDIQGPFDGERVDP